MSNYVYYQPNEKDIKDNYGDCTIRALSKVLDCSWLEAFDKMIPYCRKYQLSNIFNAPLQIRKDILYDFNFEYKGVSNKKGTKRVTVKEFVSKHKTGTYILVVAHHVVAAVNGHYYDTWDSGNRPMYGYFERIV